MSEKNTIYTTANINTHVWQTKRTMESNAKHGVHYKSICRADLQNCTITDIKQKDKRRTTFSTSQNGKRSITTFPPRPKICLTSI